MTQSRDDGALPRALILAGPTASGKSALALDLARRLGGVVINADSMQLYAELRVLTARPTPAEEGAVPHRLYGVRPAAEAAALPARDRLELQAYEERLRTRVASQVAIRHRAADGGGTVEIAYYSADDLARIVELLAGR